MSDVSPLCGADLTMNGFTITEGKIGTMIVDQSVYQLFVLSADTSWRLLTKRCTLLEGEEF